MNKSSEILSPAEKVLLLLCRPVLNNEDLSLLKNYLSEITDWQSIINLINAHGIIALAHYNLNKYGLTESVPDTEKNILRTGYLKSLARNSAIYSLFKVVADVALAEGIKIIPVKGLHLEMCVYGNSGLRQMNDLDILVAPEDAMKMRNALIEKGFKTIPFISPVHSYFLHSYGKHMPEMYRGGLNVEIHFRLIRDRHNAFTREMISQSNEPFPGGNSVTFSPTLIHYFLYLVKHLLWHEKTGNSQLRLYCDLIYLINKYGREILNENLFALARRLKMEHDLIIMLALLEKYFSVYTDKTREVPEISELRFRKFLHHPKYNLPEDKKDPFSEQIENIEGIHHKILYAFGMLFPSLTFMKWRYNTPSNFKALLYYPKRWFDFLRKILKNP